MPKYTLAIEEIDESIYRPVVINVISEVLTLFGLDTTPALLFKGESPQHAYLNSDIEGEYTDGNNRYLGEGYLTINGYENELNPTMLLSTPVDYPDNRPIFEDPLLGVTLTPSRISRKIEASMSLTGTEKQIERWGAIIKQKTAHGLLNGVHAVKYHYPIPHHYMGLLVEIFNRREGVKGYGDNLGAWLKKHFISTMTVIRDLSGNNPVFAIQETQRDILGWFDFGTGVPKKEKDGEAGRFILNFTYTFYIDVPETINAHFPLIIHNQMVPAEWLPRPQPMAELDFIKQQGSYSEEAFNHFRYNQVGTEYTWSATRVGLSIPEFDDWVEDEQPPGYVSILRLLSKLDPINPNRIHSLGNLGQWNIDELCKAYMVKQRQYITRPYDCLFNLQAYRYNNLLYQDQTTLTPELHVEYTEEVDFRQMYHCVIGMCYDPRQLTDIAIEGLVDNACLFKTWVVTLYPGADKFFGWDMSTCTIGSDGDHMTKDEIITIIDTITKYPGEKALWALVGFFTIYANKMSADK